MSWKHQNRKELDARHTSPTWNRENWTSGIQLFDHWRQFNFRRSKLSPSFTVDLKKWWNEVRYAFSVADRWHVCSKKGKIRTYKVPKWLLRESLNVLWSSTSVAVRTRFADLVSATANWGSSRAYPDEHTRAESRQTKRRAEFKKTRTYLPNQHAHSVTGIVV
jgi:hypothetical protein